MASIQVLHSSYVKSGFLEGILFYSTMELHPESSGVSDTSLDQLFEQKQLLLNVIQFLCISPECVKVIKNSNFMQMLLMYLSPEPSVNIKWMPNQIYNLQLQVRK
jgi:hypothetical protein